jgi:hypothetical protein
MIAAFIRHIADERLLRVVRVVEANEVSDVLETLRHAVVKKVKEITVPIYLRDVMGRKKN